MNTKTYAVVDSYEEALVVANFKTYDEALIFSLSGWTYGVVPTKTEITVGTKVKTNDRCLAW